ncbi:glycosyltransferase [Glutamicibacter arilaitensis]|uniref:glycosyltransferase n=1 Tax=Glutamicibacter arilaitensis TaxID=256701 RepID=UPI003F962FB7
MQIISIIPSIGGGGLTTAALNRSSLLTQTKHDSIVVVYEYTPDFEEIRSGLVASGRVDGKVRVLSPYSHYAEIFSDRAGYVSGALNTRPYTVHTARSKREIVETRFNSQGEPIGKIYFDRKTSSPLRAEYIDAVGKVFRTEEYSNGVLVRVNDFHGDVKIAERFLGANGFCFLRKEFDPEDGRFLRLWFWEPETQQPKLYRRIWDWRRDYIRFLSSGSDEATILLCDGNNVPAQFLRLNSDKIKPIPVLHMNHLMLDGNLRGPYATYFDQLHEFPAAVCLTTRQAKHIQEYLSQGANLAVIPNSIPSLDVPESSDLDRNEAVVVTRVVQGKGLTDVVRAFALVVEKLPNAHLSVYGDGSQVEPLTELSESLGLSKNISFMGRTDQAVSKMSQAQVSLFASKSEGFGLTIAESMSAGTPVVAMDCNYGPSELIVDGETGFVVKDRDRQVFADRIVELMSNDSLRDRMGDAGRSWTQKNLGSDAVIRKWNDLIDSLR